MEALVTVITAVLTVVSPLAISRAKNDSWTQTAKVGIPILVSVAIAVVYLSIKGQVVLVSPEDWLTTTLVIYGAQQLAYTTILRWWATILEQAGQPSAADDDGPDHRA